MSMMNTIGSTVELARSSGYEISEYSLRRWVRSGAVPSVRSGTKYLLYWPNVERFLQGGSTAKSVDTGKIRRVDEVSGL